MRRKTNLFVCYIVGSSFSSINTKLSNIKKNRNYKITLKEEYPDVDTISIFEPIQHPFQKYINKNNRKYKKANKHGNQF